MQEMTYKAIYRRSKALSYWYRVIVATFLQMTCNQPVYITSQRNLLTIKFVFRRFMFYPAEYFYLSRIRQDLIHQLFLMLQLIQLILQNQLIPERSLTPLFVEC